MPGKMMARLMAGLPGVVEEDAYDDGYPDGAAGHVSAGARIDTGEDLVRTPFGVDHAFEGERLEHGRDAQPEMVGEEKTNERVNEAVAKDKKDNKRSRSTDVATTARYITHTYQQSQVLRLVQANANRKAVVITCQSGGPCYVGGSGAVGNGTPNSVVLPTGAARTLTHQADIWVYGPAAAVVDVVEEVF